MIARVLDPTALARCLELRRLVFIEEQGVPEAVELDGLDPASEHLLALDERGEAVGAARLRPVGGGFLKLERLAVLPGARGRGHGQALVAAAVALTRERGLRHIVLNAQIGAVPFYEQLGWRAQGPVFHEAGIPHLRMELELQTAP